MGPNFSSSPWLSSRCPSSTSAPHISATASVTLTCVPFLLSLMENIGLHCRLMLHSSLFFTFYPAPHVLLPALFWEPLCTHNFSIMRRQPRLLLHSTLACGWKVTKCSLPALATAGDVSASPGTNTMQWNSQSKRMLGHHLTARSHLQEEVFWM